MLPSPRYAPHSVALLPPLMLTIRLPEMRHRAPCDTTVDDAGPAAPADDVSASKLTPAHEPCLSTTLLSSSPYTPVCHSSCMVLVSTRRREVSTSRKPGEGVTDGERVTVAVTDGDTLVDALTDGLPVTLPVIEGVMEAEGDTVGVTVMLAVTLVEGVSEALGEALEEAAGEKDTRSGSILKAC